MPEEIQTELSKIGRNLTAAPHIARQMNAGLTAVTPLVAPLPLAGVSLVLQRAHFGPGRYGRGARAGTHKHVELQIEYVVDGRICFESAAGQELLTVGHGVLIAPHLPHAWHSLVTSVMLGVELQVVGDRRQLFTDHLRDVSSDGLPDFRQDAIDELALHLCRELGHPSPWQPQRLAAWLQLWLTAVLTATVDVDAWRPPWRRRLEPEPEAICRRALIFIRENFSQPLRIADIALQAGVSERHLNRLFGKYRGSSVGAELMALRLEHARRRLEEDPNVPVKTVAGECGFNHHAYFTSCFRKAFGICPSRVQRRFPGSGV